MLALVVGWLELTFVGRSWMVAAIGVGWVLTLACWGSVVIFVTRGWVSTLARGWLELTFINGGSVGAFIGVSWMLTLACGCWVLINKRGGWALTLEAVLTLLWSVW